MKAKPTLVLLLLFLLLSLPGWAGRTAGDFEKRISETFPIRNDGRVELNNRYGEIKVVTWNQARVKVDVLIRVTARNESDFQKVLSRIDIRLTGGNNTVSAVTSINSGGKSGNWFDYFFGGGSNTEDFKIFYTVSMPESVNLNVEAKYCDVALPNLNGEVLLDVAYGDLVADRLTNRSTVSVSYGSARLEQVGNGSSVKMRYSEGWVRNGGDLRYDGRYSDVRFGKMGELRLDVGYEEIEVESATDVYFDGNYNDLSIERANRVFVDGNYSDFNFGTVTQVLEASCNYGDIDVDQLTAGFERVVIRAAYTDVQINVADDAGYSLDLDAKYGDIDAPTAGLSSRNIGSDSGREYVKGTKAGKGKGTIRISTSYGDIEIY
ncbi:DUF4097 family beta strand repeat-containing protein [Lewinella sp. JB7]|uniref:DUF4097 family beta strand repeat-containing protein n=1 Tax=Lewinella sp. JB7 TaxID=2962887 RepID=UPI0020C9CAA5|nr:DUF4097 family beta strand repeat-containing protein [Lewinella sp. JB7]MCP9236883.1 DUF4097 domain-containing protein [Lewinella sp. JB7]